MALISASKELAVKFKDAFEIARLISRATDQRQIRGGAVPVPQIMRKSFESRGGGFGHPSATDHGNIVEIITGAASATFHGEIVSVIPPWSSFFPVHRPLRKSWRLRSLCPNWACVGQWVLPIASA